MRMTSGNLLPSYEESQASAASAATPVPTDVQAELHELRQRLRAIEARPRRWLRWSWLALATALPAVALALDPKDFETGDPILAADFRDLWNATRTLEAANDEVEGRLSSLEARPPGLANVSLRYVLSASQVIPGSSISTVIGNPSVPWVRVFDTTQDAFAPMSGIFTAPVSGTYLISAAISWISRAAGTSNRFFVDGSSIGPHFLDDCVSCQMASGTFMQQGTYTAFLDAGETVYISAQQDSGVNVPLVTDSRANYIQINLIGN